jgi:hypothetical protein
MTERPGDPHGLQPVTERLLTKLLIEMKVEEPEHEAILQVLLRRMRLEGITPVGMLLVPDTFDGLVAVATAMLDRHYPREYVLGNAFLSYLRAALDCLEDPFRGKGGRETSYGTVAKRRREMLEAQLARIYRSSQGGEE